MKAAIITLLTSFCLSLNASDYPVGKGHISWQPPLQKNDDYSLKTSFSACNNYKGCGKNNPQILPAFMDTKLTAEPGQSIIVCAENILLTADYMPQVIGTTLSNDKKTLHHIQMISREAQLALIEPYQCPESLQQLYPYNVASPFLSEQPFVVSLIENLEKKADGSSEDSLLLAPPGSTPSAPGAPHSHGGAFSFDDYGDDFFRRRPGGGYFPSGQDITLTFLPLVRLGWDWQRILPMNLWQHWLLGSRNEEAGVTLAIRFNQTNPVYLQLSQTDFRALSEVLHDTRQVLQYLAPRLSGRQAFIEQLLTLYSTTPTLSRHTRQAIRQQVTALLDWPDTEFNLDFEVRQLHQAISESIPPKWIKELPKNKKQQDVKIDGEKSPGTRKKTSSAQGGSSADEKKSTGDHNDAGQPSGASATDTRQNTAVTGSQLTISFVGRFDAGKSTLANCLLGFKHFEVNFTQTTVPEPDAVIQPERNAPERTIRIRSLPGYGRGGEDEWFRNNPIAPTEVLVFVFAEPAKKDDFDVIRRLVDKGHDIKRMVFVRNKFDLSLDVELEQRNEQGNPVALPGIISELQDDFRQEFQKDLQGGWRRGRQEVSHINLYFTSCSDLYKCKGIKKILDAIENLLRDADERITFRDFTSIRRTLPDLLQRYSDWFLEALRHNENDITHYILRKFAQSEPDLLSLLPENQLSQMRQIFEKQYGYSYNDRALSLRYMETMSNTEASMVQRHAEALLKFTSVEDRELYLSGLQEEISKLRFSGSPENDLSENIFLGSLDLSAVLQATQYVSGFREKILKAKGFWTSKREFLKAFHDQLYRAIDASLVIANRQRELSLPGRSQSSSSDTASQAEATQKFRDELFDSKRELVRQFSTMLTNLTMPARYNLQKKTESEPTQINLSPPESNSPSLASDTDSDAPIVYGPSTMVDVDATSHGTLEPDPDTLSPEPASEAERPMADNTAMVTLSNGFTRQYTLNHKASLFSLQELAASLAAFETSSELVEAMKKPEGLKSLRITTNEGSNRYHYFFISVDKGWGTEVGRTSIAIWQAGNGAEKPQQTHLWVDFSRVSIGNALLGIQGEAIRRLDGVPFATKTFVYTSPADDLGLTRTLLLTQTQVSNLGQVMVLQNTPSNEVSNYLPDSPLNGRQRLTRDELIRLALQLSEGMKTLVSQKLHLKKLDVASIAIQPDTLSPYVADPLALRLENPGNVDRAILANLRRSESQQEDLEAGTTMPENQIVYWLGQIFTLLSGKAPIFYQKKIVPRLRMLTTEELNILDVYKSEQLKDTVADALGREGIRSRAGRGYPGVSTDKSAIVNLLLLARSMLRENPASRPSLSKVIDDLNSMLQFLKYLKRSVACEA